MKNKEKFLDTAKQVAFNMGCDALSQAISTAVCSFISRKINYMIDRQEQDKMIQEAHPPVQEKRIGFSSNK